MRNPSKAAIDAFLNKPKGRYNRTVVIVPKDVEISDEVREYAKEKDVKFAYRGDFFHPKGNGKYPKRGINERLR